MSLPPYVYLHRRTKDGSPRYVARVRVDGRVRSSRTFATPEEASAWLRRYLGDVSADTELAALRDLEAAVSRGDGDAAAQALRRVRRTRLANRPTALPAAPPAKRREETQP